MKATTFLYKNRYLIGRMAFKEATDRYAGSALGLLWTILQPLFLISLYAIVFTFVFKVRVGVNDSPIRYALYAITGLIPWISMAEALSKSVLAVYSKAPLVKQAIFPTEILPVSTVIASFFSLVAGLIIYLILSAILMPSQLSFWMFLLPVVIFLQLIFSIGIGYYLAIIGVYFRDILELVTMFLTIGLFVTPILYIEGSIPYQLQFVMNFNLAAHLINMYRDILFYGHINHPWSFLIFGLASVIFFFSGYYSFKKVKHLFANVL